MGHRPLRTGVLRDPLHRARSPLTCGTDSQQPTALGPPQNPLCPQAAPRGNQGVSKGQMWGTHGALTRLIRVISIPTVQVPITDLHWGQAVAAGTAEAGGQTGGWGAASFI